MIGITAQIAIKDWQDVNTKIDELEAQLEALKDRRITLECKTIPNELAANGLSRLTTDDGYEIKLDKFIKPKVLDKDGFYSWLDDQGYGAIIKTSFDLDKGVETGGIEDFLVGEGISYTKEVGIHHKSLEKAVREIVQQAEESNPEVRPEQIFPSSVEIDVFTKASIKRSK